MRIWTSRASLRLTQRLTQRLTRRGIRLGPSRMAQDARTRLGWCLPTGAP
jgi:hypothetical protein